MLLDEVEIFLTVDHMNVCKLIEVYEDGDGVHLVMELCHGRALADRLASKHRYSEKDAAFACWQMLLALNYMHSQGFCHRDIKLENWLYSDDSDDATLKLIDFGLSKVFEDMPMAAIEGTAAYMAPEVWEGNYDEKCDMWALGVIMHMLLSGTKPPEGMRSHEVNRWIMTHGYSVDGPAWSNISESGKDFVMRLLEEESEDRMTAQEAIEHDWIQTVGHQGESEEISLDVLQHIRAFSNGTVMLRAACCLTALSMTVDDFDELERQFLALDHNNSGTISLEELTSILRSKLGMSEDDARKVFNRLDLSGDPQVQYSEFIAASLQSRFQRHSPTLREAFQRFDINNTGKITEENLRTLLGPEFSGISVEYIFAAADLDGDGALGYDEFVQAVVGPRGSERHSRFGVMREIVRNHGSAPTLSSKDS